MDPLKVTVLFLAIVLVLTQMVLITLRVRSRGKRQWDEMKARHDAEMAAMKKEIDRIRRSVRGDEV